MLQQQRRQGANEHDTHNTHDLNARAHTYARYACIHCPHTRTDRPPACTALPAHPQPAPHAHSATHACTNAHTHAGTDEHIRLQCRQDVCAGMGCIGMRVDMCSDVPVHRPTRSALPRSCGCARRRRSWLARLRVCPNIVFLSSNSKGATVNGSKMVEVCPAWDHGRRTSGAHFF